MRFKYVGGIGLPHDSKIVCDRNRKILKTLYKTEYGRGELFSVCTPDLKLFLHFRTADGVFIGLSCEKIDLQTLPHSDIEIPYAPDGEVKADCRLRDIIPDCTYVAFDGAAVCDGNENSVLFGKIPQGGAVFRVLENAYISLDSEGSLCGIAVKL